MAWNQNNYDNGGPRQNQNRSSGGRSENRRQEQKPIIAKPLPTNYVDTAESVMQKTVQVKARGRLVEKQLCQLISTSKLRNLLSQFVDTYNRENLRSAETLEPESVNALMMARIRMLYEAGRDSDVKCFIENADLLPYLKGIGNSRANMINYYHYLEALVAYHKYYGGKEN